MILPLPRLLRGIIDTLEQQVAVALSAGSARAQLYACLDLINNLADKIDWKHEILEAETSGVEEVLRASVPLLKRMGPRFADLSRKVSERLQSPPESDLFERRRRLNQDLEDLIAAVNDPTAAFDRSEDLLAGQIRQHIHAHLRNQTIRDALYLKPMMLKKISEG